MICKQNISILSLRLPLGIKPNFHFPVLQTSAKVVVNKIPFTFFCLHAPQLCYILWLSKLMVVLLQGYRVAGTLVTLPKLLFIYVRNQVWL